MLATVSTVRRQAVYLHRFLRVEEQQHPVTAPEENMARILGGENLQAQYSRVEYLSRVEVVYVKGGLEDALNFHTPADEHRDITTYRQR